MNKWLAQSGVCSRREADELIAAGAVLIDGERVSDAGRKISAGQTLVLNDRAELGLEAQISVMIHKPVGVVSAQPDPGQTPAARLLTSERQAGSGSVPSSRASLPPLGRLDQDSRGLLMLSEDGVLAKAIIGPESEVDKEYVVTVQVLRFVLNEGRNRQIRRMCELVELEVTDLIRVRIGPLLLGDLPEGKWRHLTAAERDALVKAGG